MISIPKTKEDAVLYTLAFFSLFDRALTLSELRERLLTFDISLVELRDICQQSPRICIREDICWLCHHEESFHSLQQQRNLTQKRFRKVFRYRWLFQCIPFIRGVSVCNNLSFGIAKQQGDIDLFIQTDSKHLFLSRFLVTGFLHILGVRRHGNKTQNRFCLSFYTTTDNDKMQSIALQPHDIYLAYWTLLLQPLMNAPLYQQFMTSNRAWLEQYFSIAVIQQRANYVQQHIKKDNNMLKGIQFFQEVCWKTWIGRWIEKKLAMYQKQKIQKHVECLPEKKGTIISDNMLKFHDVDKRSYYQHQWFHTIITYLSNYVS